MENKIVIFSFRKSTNSKQIIKIKKKFKHLKEGKINEPEEIEKIEILQKTRLLIFSFSVNLNKRKGKRRRSE